MKKLLILLPLALLSSCALFQQPNGLETAIDVIQKSDLPNEVKAAIIEAMRAAFAGNEVGQFLRGAAGGAAALVAGYFGLKISPALMQKITGQKPDANPPASASKLQPRS